jgi:hypothetical protein
MSPEVPETTVGDHVHITPAGFIHVVAARPRDIPRTAVAIRGVDSGG